MGTNEIHLTRERSSGKNIFDAEKKTLYYLYIIIFSASKIFFPLLLSLVRWISLVFSFGLISLSTSFSDNSFVLTKSWQSCSSHALYFCEDFIPSRPNFRKANL